MRKDEGNDQVYHLSPLFSAAPIREPLIYFKRSWKTFSITFSEVDSSQVFNGTYKFSGAINLDVSVEALPSPISLSLKPDPNYGLFRKMGGTAPLLGDILCEGQQLGNCRVENSHSENDPVIRIRGDSLPGKLDAFRSDPILVSCPLLVFGIRDCEMVMQDYSSLTREQRRCLPDAYPKRQFVGSCRSIRFNSDFMGSYIQFLAILVAVNEFIVKDSYMSI